jgi:hypothetical protein
VSGVEQLVVWLFGLFLAAVSVCSVARSLAQARVDVATQVAQSTVEANRIVAEVRSGAVYPPAAWSAEEGL